MAVDAKREPTWTALLPGGRRTRLRLARGVRLCVGDVLRVGRKLYTVARRETIPEPDGCVFVVELVPARGRPGAAPPGRVAGCDSSSSAARCSSARTSSMRRAPAGTP
jgi:hypothetical protein